MKSFVRSGIFGIGLIIATIGAVAQADAAPLNLVTNGDFSSGDVGFDSDYESRPGLGWDPGTYTVTENPADWHPYFVSLGDHTTGSGSMFVGNGSTTPGETFWQSGPIDVADGQHYYFEAFVANVCCNEFVNQNADSILTFALTFNGGPTISLGTRTTPSTAGVWEGLSTEWLSVGAGTVVLSLANQSPIYSGNDFALDDIYFGSETSLSPVPEPATLALLLSGIPLAQAARRRRAARQAATRRS